MKWKIALVMIGALSLGACATDQGLTTQKLVAVVPPTNLYQCPNPPHPNPDGLHDKQVSQYIVKMKAARDTCEKSLQAIKTYSTEVEQQIDSEPSQPLPLHP